MILIRILFSSEPDYLLIPIQVSFKLDCFLIPILVGLEPKLRLGLEHFRRVEFTHVGRIEKLLEFCKRDFPQRKTRFKEVRSS